MYQYVLLLTIPAIFSIHYSQIIQNRVTPNGNIALNNDNTLSVFFFLFFLLLSLRHETIGRDLIGYKFYFNKYSEQNISEIFYTWQESFFRLYNWLLGRLTNNYQIYLAVTAAITVFPIAWVYNKDRTQSYLKIVLFINMSTFIMLFSGIRQAMAMSVGMLAYHFVVKKRLFWFIVLAFIALLFHHSGFMVFLMYPAYHIKLQKKHLFFVVPTIILIYILRNQVFGFLTSILSETTDKYDQGISNTGAYGSLLLFLLFAIFTYTICDESKMDAETMGLRNFLVLTVVLQIFALLNPLSMRLNYYFILFVPITLGKCINCCKTEFYDIARTGKVVTTIFFTFYFLYSTYESNISGISALDTIPYKFFWQ